MRTLFVIVFMVISAIGYCNLYVAIDKESGQVNGTVEVLPENIGEWAKDFTMKEADESFRGKNGYEIKFEKGKLRPATKEEIGASQPKKTEVLSQDDIKKLKDLIK